MICKRCKERETRKPHYEICEACRTREWRKNNPKKVKSYSKMRQKRDVVKIREWQMETRNKTLFGGNRWRIMDRDNWECQNCGMTQEQCMALFGRSLTIHHIDGNGRGCNNPNNDMYNLITLCFRCHPKADLGRIDFSSFTKQSTHSEVSE